MHWLSNDASFFHIVPPFQNVFIAPNSTSTATPISLPISQPKNAAVTSNQYTVSFDFILNTCMHT